MNKVFVSTAAILGAITLMGCDNKTETPQAPSAPSTPSAAEKQASDVAKSVTDKATSAATDAKDATAAAATDAKNAASSALDDAKKQLGEDPQTLIDKAMGFVKENKLTDAQAILDKLEAVKAKLPADWASKIDGLKSAIETAKKGAAALPGGLPGVGK